MGTTISVGIQKGGVGKTTTTAIICHLLSKEAKVLAVDFDSQGNLTQMLTQRNIYDFTKQTILEACKTLDPRPYIHEITDTLHILPAEDILATFSRYLYQEYRRPDFNHVLRKTLDVVKNEYDFVVIDLPPNLGDQTLNGLTASDYAVVMLQSEPFCYDALDRYMETLDLVQKNTNKDLRVAGILTAMMDTRTSIDSAILDKARADWGEIVFETVIRRKSRIKEFALEGIADRTKADREALEPYAEFVRELKERVHQN